MTTLQPLRRRVAAVSAPVLLALSLTACGGGDAASAPEDASVEDFCSTQQDIDVDLDEDDSGEVLDAIKESADKLAEVGTPADFSDDARDGFEIYIDFVENADESDVESNDSSEDVFGEEDAAKVDAFFLESAQACTPDLGDLEGDLPTDAPS